MYASGLPAHNLKVAGSNPAPATTSEISQVALSASFAVRAVTFFLSEQTGRHHHEVRRVVTLTSMCKPMLRDVRLILQPIGIAPASRN